MCAMRKLKIISLFEVNMIPVLSVENMRKSDAYTIANSISSKDLMFRAGESVFKNVKWNAPVAVICGTGNNAGDGYVIANLLHAANIKCDIILLEEKFSEDGLFYFKKCKNEGVPVKIWDSSICLSEYSTLVDCIFGTGFKGNVTGIAKNVIEAINSSNAYVVSVDINSGLNGDTGIAELCVESDITLSIGGFKSGHFLNMAKDVIKRKVNCEIGIKPIDRVYELLESNDLIKLFSPRANYSDKRTYGYIALIGGSKKYSGAIRLAAMASAAMRSGAGVVKIAIPNSLYHDLVPLILESTIFPLSDYDGEIKFCANEISSLISNVKTIAFGMGIGVSDELKQILIYLLNNYKGTLIIDADGLTLLSQVDSSIIKQAECKIVLTPHLNEFSRLTKKSISEILASPIKIAEQYAKCVGVILLLKGPTTIITDGEKTYLVDAGCPGMATAGSGDVLSGIIAAISAYSQNLLLGVAASAFINGKAGEVAQEKLNSISMTASDTIACIPNVISSFGGGK